MPRCRCGCVQCRWSGLGRLAVVAQGGLEAPVAPAVFLQREQAGAARGGGLDVGLVALGGKAALRCLHAQHAAPARQGCVLQFHAGAVGLVLESGDGGAVLHLVVLVVGDAGAQAQGGEACKGVAQLAPDVQALAAQVHHGHVAVFVFMAVVVAVVLAVAAAVQVVAVGVAAFKAVVVAGQAVFGGLAGVGGTQVARVAHPEMPTLPVSVRLKLPGTLRSTWPSCSQPGPTR